MSERVDRKENKNNILKIALVSGVLVFLCLIIVVIVVNRKPDSDSMNSDYVPELNFKVETVISTSNKYKDMNVRAYNETLPENQAKANDLQSRRSNLVPQKISANFDFNQTYLSLMTLEGGEKIDQAFLCSDLGRGLSDLDRIAVSDADLSHVYIREGEKLYRVIWDDGTSLNDLSKKTLISNKCKKIVYGNSDDIKRWGYITTDGEIVFFGTAQYMPGLKGNTDVFGKKLIRGGNELPTYNGETVLQNITDFWFTTYAFFYEQENCLYRIDNDINKEPMEKIAEDVNVSSFTSIDVGEQIINDWDIPGTGTYVYTMQDGSVYGFGKNSGYIINSEESDREYFNTPVKIDMPIKAKQVYGVNGIGIYVRDFNDDLYFWGYPGYRTNFKDKRLRSKEYNNLIIPAQTPILIEKNVSDIVVDNKTVQFLNDSQELITYQVQRQELKKSCKYIPCIKREVEQTDISRYFNKHMFVKDNELILDPRYLFYGEWKWGWDIDLDDIEKFSSYWWIKYDDFYCKGFYSKTPYLVTEGVEKVSGRNYFKDGKWYKFKANGQSEVLFDHDVQKIYSLNNDYFYLKDNNLYCSNKKMIHFSYKKKKEIKQTKKDYLMEQNVTDMWADEGNIAFVKDGILYTYGEVEHLRWEGFDPDEADYYTWKMPPNIVKYSGINVENIENITFDMQNIYVFMKGGTTYKIVPEQKEDKKWYRQECRVDNSMKMKNTNLKFVEQSAFNYYGGKGDLSNITIDREGKAVMWQSKLSYNFDRLLDMPKTRVEIPNVKDYLSVGCWAKKDVNEFLLMGNGELIGWGQNDCNEVSDSKKSSIKFKDRTIIATGVATVTSTGGHGILYLTEKGALYFRGYNGNDYCDYYDWMWGDW